MRKPLADVALRPVYPRVELLRVHRHRLYHPAREQLVLERLGLEVVKTAETVKPDRAVDRDALDKAHRAGKHLDVQLDGEERGVLRSCNSRTEVGENDAGDINYGPWFRSKKSMKRWTA